MTNVQESARTCTFVVILEIARSSAAASKHARCLNRHAVIHEIALSNKIIILIEEIVATTRMFSL
jgi:hypothetical protein